MTSKLRTLHIGESDDCAKLIYISGPDLYSYIFAEGTPKVYEIIKILLEQPGSMFSGENVVVEEEDGRMRGLIVAYPARDMMKMGIRMIKCIKKMYMISGFINFMKILSRICLNKLFPGTENDEFFISNLAVFEEYRGKGIGTKLLEKAEKKAAEKGLDKLSLYVETDNTHAKSLYERLCYREVKKAVLPESYNKYNLYGFYKMHKIIEKRG